jgi:hypothetical protein
MRALEEFRLRRLGLTPHYRSREGIEATIHAAGFRIETVEPSAPASEEIWFVAERSAPGEAKP